jgi:D-alanyl-D-alanine carboxypeptidase
MSYTSPARTSSRQARSAVVAALVLAVVAVGVSASPLRVLLGGDRPTTALGTPEGGSDRPRPPAAVAGAAVTAPAGTQRRRSISGTTPLALPHRATGGGAALDDTSPTVARLDPALLSALRHAATDAAGDGVELVVTSGWRSAEHQQRLLREAVATYGSEKEAARWVATPRTSAHVSGDAVDIGPAAGDAWLSRHGSRYGLCQTYRNEPWHYELRPRAVASGCPAMYADPTHDPRMHR